jgi:hypothetical protein
LFLCPKRKNPGFSRPNIWPRRNTSPYLLFQPSFLCMYVLQRSIPFVLVKEQQQQQLSDDIYTLAHSSHSTCVYEYEGIPRWVRRDSEICQDFPIFWNLSQGVAQHIR